MKTIKQIADELGIDKQRVYRHIKRNHITESHQDNGMMYYAESAEAQIKQHFSDNIVLSDVDHEPHQSTSSDTVNDVLISMLQTELEVKNQQIEELQAELKQEREHSRQQADKLSDLSQQLAELTRNSQILLKQEQEKTTLLLPEQSPTVSSAPDANGTKIKQRPFWQFWKK